MEKNTTVKAHHFRQAAGKLHLNTNEYLWYLPETVRAENIQRGDVVLVNTSNVNRYVVVAEVLDEDDETAKAKYNWVIKKIDMRISIDDIDFERLKARKAANIADMERKREAKAAKKAARKAAMEKMIAENAAKKAEKAAADKAAADKGKKKPKSAAANPKSKPAAPAKSTQFDRIKTHLANKINEQPQDSDKSRSAKKRYDEYMKWLAPRQQEIDSGTLQYADVIDEVAKITGLRISKKTES